MSALIENYDVVVVTGDRDLTQLTTDKITVAVTVKGVSEIEEYTPSHVEEKIGLIPEQIIDMKALVGDTSDNYPGVTKIGEKTAIKLLKQYGTLDGIYKNIDKVQKAARAVSGTINSTITGRVADIAGAAAYTKTSVIVVEGDRIILDGKEIGRCATKYINRTQNGKRSAQGRRDRHV